MRIFLRRENRKGFNQNGGGVGCFEFKSPPTNFQTLTHQISLLTRLHTLNNLFQQKLKNNLFYYSKDPFHCIFYFSSKSG